MITITVSGFFIFLLSAVVIYLLYVINNKNKEIAELQSSHEQQLLEIKDLAVSKDERTKEAFSRVIDKQLATIEMYESYILSISSAIKLSGEKIQELDLRGTFESDDEIGFFFKNVKEIQDVLNKFKVELLQKKFADDNEK